MSEGEQAAHRGRLACAWLPTGDELLVLLGLPCTTAKWAAGSTGSVPACQVRVKVAISTQHFSVVAATSVQQSSKVAGPPEAAALQAERAEPEDLWLSASCGPACASLPG